METIDENVDIAKEYALETELRMRENTVTMLIALEARCVSFRFENDPRFSRLNTLLAELDMVKNDYIQQMRKVTALMCRRNGSVESMEVSDVG